jgi:hypothetical protein
MHSIVRLERREYIILGDVKMENGCTEASSPAIMKSKATRRVTSIRARAQSTFVNPKRLSVAFLRDMLPVWSLHIDHSADEFLAPADEQDAGLARRWFSIVVRGGVLARTQERAYS